MRALSGFCKHLLQSYKAKSPPWPVWGMGWSSFQACGIRLGFDEILGIQTDSHQCFLQQPYTSVLLNFAVQCQLNGAETQTTNMKVTKSAKSEVAFRDSLHL